MPLEGLENVFNNTDLGIGLGRFANNVTGTSANNDFYAAEAALQREWSSSEAEKAFQRELMADSTKYQRTMADLARSGVNPLMAVAGASAGSVSSAPASASSASSGSGSGGVIISAILRGVSQIVSSAIKGSASTTAAAIRSQK